jgi:hypothetical protein
MTKTTGVLTFPSPLRVEPITKPSLDNHFDPNITFTGPLSKKNGCVKKKSKMMGFRRKKSVNLTY